MPGGSELSSYIPYLRRFSRALTGAQSVGDALVLTTLQTIMANAEAFRAGPNVRASLYRTFLTVWESAPRDADLDASALSPDERGAREQLGLLAARPRIAFLLSALEGFSPADIAAVMDAPRVETDALIDQASRTISRQLRTETLIIEDEPFIALDIKSLLEELGHTVTAIARTHTEAVKSVAAKRPGLILADIQLADGSSGLEAVNQILTQFEIPVIFVTAYPERFLTGKPPEPAFLITKPFGVESLKAIISQALFFGRRSRPVAP